MKTLEILRAISQLDPLEEIEIVLNVSYGGFSVKKCVYDELGLEWDGHGHLFSESHRTDEKLIAAIKKFGDKASNEELSIKTINIDDVLTAYIKNYDGKETIEYSSCDLCTPIIKMI